MAIQIVVTSPTRKKPSLIVRGGFLITELLGLYLDSNSGPDRDRTDDIYTARIDSRLSKVLRVGFYRTERYWQCKRQPFFEW
jgi:hypothetical protein